MTMNSTTGDIKIYEVTIKNLSRNFAMDAELSKVEQKALLILGNPHYSSLIEKYQHIKGVVMKDNNQKLELPVHILLNVVEYSKITTNAVIGVQKQRETIAEIIHFGWTITSPAKDCNFTSMMLTKISICDRDQLCRLDVLCIEDIPTRDQMYVYQEFQNQLELNANGSHKTTL